MLSFARDLIVIERWGSCLAAWLFIVPCHTLLAEWTSWAYWKLCMHLNIYKRYEYGHFTCLCVLDYSWMNNLISSTLVMSQSPVLSKGGWPVLQVLLSDSGITVGQQRDCTTGAKNMTLWTEVRKMLFLFLSIINPLCARAEINTKFFNPYSG